METQVQATEVEKQSPIANVIAALRAAGFEYVKQKYERTNEGEEVWMFRLGDDKEQFSAATVRYYPMVHVDGPIRKETGKYAISIGEGYGRSNYKYGAYPACRYKQRKDGSYDVDSIVERVKDRVAKALEYVEQEKQSEARAVQAEREFEAYRKEILGDLPYHYHRMLDRCTYKKGMVLVWLSQTTVTPEHAKALLEAIYEVDKKFTVTKKEPDASDGDEQSQD
jgi:hypothetical protein